MAGPIAISVAFVWIVTRYVGFQAPSIWALAGWWLILSLVSTGILIGLDRLARRALPLATLLQLSLVFPDEAPSRFHTAMGSLTTKQLHQELRRAREGGDDTPNQAATRLLRFVATLTAHDRLTRGHSERVRAYSQMIGAELGLPEEDIDRLNWAALVHDVGKLVVPPEVLNKEGRPNDEEWAMLRSHAEEGAKLVAPLQEWLGGWCDAVGQHHERWDGKGYPCGLQGEEISLGGRIVAVADVFDVMTSPRSYKAAGSMADARRELTDCAGSQFDPQIVRTFLNVSLGRMRVAAGPLTWIANIPFIGQASVSSAVGGVAGSVAVASTALVGVLAGGALAQEPQTPTPVTAEAPAPVDSQTTIRRPPSTETAPLVDEMPTPSPAPPSAPKQVSAPARTPAPAPATPGSAESPAGPAPQADSPDTPAPATETPPESPASVSFVAPDLSPSLTEDVPATLAMGLPNPSGVTSLRITREPDYGQIWVPADDTVRYVPESNFNGLVTSEYEACWRASNCDTGTIFLSVAPVNDAPVAVPDTVGTGDSETMLDVLANDIDVDGDQLTLALDAGALALAPTRGAVGVVDGRIKYTPPLAFAGTDTFEYSVTDGNGGTDTGSVEVTVSPDNAPPVAGDDTVTLSEGSVTTFGVLANDSDPNGAGLTLAGYDDSGITAGSLAHNGGGSFTYTPPGDFVGTESFAYKVVDARGGGDSASVGITVTGINDPPGFFPGANVTVREDAGAQTIAGWATGIDPGPSDEAVQTVSFTVTSDNPGLFSAPPALAQDGSLSFTPQPDANGVATITVTPADDGGTANGGVDTGAPQTASITVTPVNDAPTLAVGADVTVAEDAGAQSVAGWVASTSSGPADEAGQNLTFAVSNDNAALFAAAPTVANDGTLNFTPQADASGSATITVVPVDDGGTADGGVNAGAGRTATITVLPVNDAPSATAGADITVGEDAGTQTRAAWATGISPGPADESGQTVGFAVSNDNPGLFAVGPTVATDGTLTFAAAADANGSATVTITPVDDGGTPNGGADAGTAGTATITVDPVNDAPSFAPGADVTVAADAGAQSIAGWATAIIAGPADEAPQVVSFNVSNDNPTFFLVQPALATDGTLTFTPDPDRDGTATISVEAVDNGGTANGGADTGPTRTAAITLNPPASTSVLYLGSSGSSADEWGLTPFAPGAADPVPDTDSDGQPGLTIAESSGSDTETGGGVFQDWVYAPSGAPLRIDGPITLTLWLSSTGVPTGRGAWLWAYLYECDAGGANCTTFEQINTPLFPWSDTPGWFFHWRYVAWGNRTIAPGRELRLRLLSSGAAVRLASTGAYESRLRVSLG